MIGLHITCAYEYHACMLYMYICRWRTRKCQRSRKALWKSDIPPHTMLLYRAGIWPRKQRCHFERFWYGRNGKIMCVKCGDKRKTWIATAKPWEGVRLTSPCYDLASKDIIVIKPSIEANVWPSGRGIDVTIGSELSILGRTQAPEM